jgi:hypothetical protein
MSKSIWRVEWDIDKGKGPHTSIEFPSEITAMTWAEGIAKAGGRGIIVTELIVGRKIKFESEKNLFSEK